MPSSPLPGQPGFVVPAPGDRPRLHRRAVRVLLVDDADRLLLFLDSDLGLDPVSHWWVTPGGGVDPGESDHDAAVLKASVYIDALVAALRHLEKERATGH